jgi:uncharacterized protein (TIGR03083 family)
MQSNTPDLDFLGFIEDESARFARALDNAPHDAPVPSCPDWNAADLLWHLSEVQWFWGTIVKDKLDVDQAQARKPARPADWDGLREFYATSSSDLLGALTSSPADTPAWTWSADQTVGFIRRRQAHEALIHRIDAELVADGQRTSMDPALSADGVDEVLRIMYGGIPEWGVFTADDGRTVKIATSDTGHSWLFALGRFTGTSPETKRSYDEPQISVIDDPAGAVGAATITGTAADLDCMLWHRPPTGPIERSGDEDALSAFDTAIAAGID